jgi:serine/threonine protein kinase HipA of HipAB toxin-antitoxin module
MPLARPAQSAWPALAERLELGPRRPSWRRPLTLALAASLAMLALVPALWIRQLQQNEAQAIAALQAQSSSLEAEISQLRTQSVALDDGLYAWQTAVERDLSLVDVGLSSSVGAERELLWQQRVELLRELKLAHQQDTGALLLQASLD